jgi:hypothetical protein
MDDEGEQEAGRACVGPVALGLGVLMLMPG